VYRFDDPVPSRAGAFGTCYTASTIEVAFAESVIHESGRARLEQALAKV
jgi:hypothetical protein